MLISAYTRIVVQRSALSAYIWCRDADGSKLRFWHPAPRVPTSALISFGVYLSLNDVPVYHGRPTIIRILRNIYHHIDYSICLLVLVIQNLANVIPSLIHAPYYAKNGQRSAALMPNVDQR